MSKVFGLLLIVLFVWTGVEIYTNGMTGAFGGVFVKMGLAQPEQPATGEPDQGQRPVTERAAGKWQDAHEKNTERIENQVGE